MKIHNMIKTNVMRKYRKTLSITLASLLLAATFPVNGGAALAKSTSATFSAAAGSDFVYVFRTQQGFGDVATGGTFRGEDETFTFTLPSTLASGTAHVMLSASAVGNSCNRFEINGTQVSILVNRNNSSPFVTEIQDIPSGILKPGTNTLTIRSLNPNCTTGGDLDEFVLSNVVVFYHVQ